MFSAKRMEEITKILERDGSVDVNNLSKSLGVTAKTIRQDFDRLEEIGLLERVHGGAVLKQNGNGIYPIQQRKQRNLAEKVRIAEAALALIDEGDTVILDGGSTTLELAKRLGEKRVVVVTNDLLIAGELLQKEGVTLYVTGGKLRREGIFTLLGREAERTVRKYNANKLFLGTSALDFAQGLMVLSEDEAEIKKAMIASATRVIALVDHSKFHKLAFVSFATLREVDLVITDSRVTAADRRHCEEIGLKLEIA